MLIPMKEITVQAEWHQDARIWTATSEDVWGLAAQAPDLETLKAKVLPMIADLLELNHVEVQSTDIPIHFVAKSTNTLHLTPVG